MRDRFTPRVLFLQTLEKSSCYELFSCEISSVKLVIDLCTVSGLDMERAVRTIDLYDIG